MRILACSDLHCDLTATRRFVDAAAQADVVVVAGDIATQGQGAAPLLDLLKSLRRQVVLVAGNHDRLSDLRSYCAPWAQGHVLHGDGVRVQGVPFFGLGGEIPRNNDAVWNFSVSETQAARALQGCPPCAVLVTHSPPKGFCDRQKDGTHDGSDAVLEVIRRTAPRLHLCGHVHAAFGQSAQAGHCNIHNLGPTPTWFEV
jgi:Icc-related predicted phosphoesterase